MNVPEELRYSTEHEWVRTDDDTVVVGITDYAQDALGDVVFVDLPEVGTEVTAGEPMGEVESTKSVSDLFAPVSGTLTQVNDSLADQPEQLNHDADGDGWLVDIEPADSSQVESLHDAEGNRAVTEH